MASSRSESLVQMSTTRPYSGFSVKSMIPGCVLNCSRTSKTTRPAARPTAMIARPEKKNTTDAPTMRPTSAFGLSIDRLKVFAALPSAVSTVVRNAPNSAVAASTAVAIAMPLVIALVVLPTASSLVSTCRGLAFDVAAHLRDALGVVRDRAEGVHRDDHADRGQQAGAGQCDREQRDRGVAGAEQERPVHRRADQQRRVHGGLQADRDPGQDHRGRRRCARIRRSP